MPITGSGLLFKFMTSKPIIAFFASVFLLLINTENNVDAQDTRQTLSYGQWMSKVSQVADKRGYDIKGDERYFERWYKRNLTPEQAIWHWANDPWPNMGGGE